MHASQKPKEIKQQLSAGTYDSAQHLVASSLSKQQVAEVLSYTTYHSPWTSIALILPADIKKLLY